jgi:hypothetical protein
MPEPGIAVPGQARPGVLCTSAVKEISRVAGTCDWEYYQEVLLVEPKLGQAVPKKIMSAPFVVVGCRI